MKIGNARTKLKPGKSELSNHDKHKIHEREFRQTFSYILCFSWLKTSEQNSQRV